MLFIELLFGLRRRVVSVGLKQVTVVEPVAHFRVYHSTASAVFHGLDLSRFDAAPLIAFTACMDAPIGASGF